MSGLLFRLYHDSGISAWVCRIFGCAWRPAGFHYRSCLRCSRIEAVVRDD